MAEHRRDKTERLTAGAPPRIKVARAGDGKLKLAPDAKPDGVHPETVAEERPPQPEDPRSVFDKNVGGPYYGV